LNNFPEAIKKLPEADIPLKGVNAYLAQCSESQILFMEVDEDVELPAHSHKAQWGIVLKGKIFLNINGEEKTYTQGENYYIPENTIHSGKIYAGYADITYFDEKARYNTKPE